MLKHNILAFYFMTLTDRLQAKGIADRLNAAVISFSKSIFISGNYNRCFPSLNIYIPPPPLQTKP